MRSLQLFLGAYLAGAGYAEHMEEDEADASKHRLLTVPGLPLTWSMVMRRKRHASGRPLRAH